MNSCATSTIPTKNENRIAPDFSIIGQALLRKILTIVGISLHLALFFFFQFGPDNFLSSRQHPSAVPVLLLFPSFLYLSGVHGRRRMIRSHPLVRSGEARAAGFIGERQWSRKDQGFLFLTRSELVFVPRDGGAEQRIFLAEIDAVRNPRLHGLRMKTIEVSSGDTTKRFCVPAPKSWLEEIEAARSGIQKAGQ